MGDVNGKMASNDEDLCTGYPDFAVICSFIENFGEKLGLNLPNIEEFQKILEDTENVSDQLIQTVIQLLRRLNKSVAVDKWERGLQKYAHTYSIQDGWGVEGFGFKQAKPEVKIRVVKNLLESQFDSSRKFKDKVNLMTANELRLQPNGRDKHGLSYWCQLDDQANLRIYSDDQDEEMWTLIAKTREELVALIQKLESESPPCASREMSVDGSVSGTATPMGLSNAPTPVESAVHTPVDSGRTSPVIDTGQEKDNIKLDKIQEKSVRENVEDRGAENKDGKENLVKENKENKDTKDSSLSGANRDKYEDSLERKVIKSLEEKGMTSKEEKEDINKKSLLGNKSTKDEGAKNNKSVENKLLVPKLKIKINEINVKEENSQKVLNESNDKEHLTSREKNNSDSDKSIKVLPEKTLEKHVAKEEEDKSQRIEKKLDSENSIKISKQKINETSLTKEVKDDKCQKPENKLETTKPLKISIKIRNETFVTKKSDNDESKKVENNESKKAENNESKKAENNESKKADNNDSKKAENNDRKKAENNESKKAE